MEFSQTRDWTHVLCIGRWILIHCTTREVLIVVLVYDFEMTTGIEYIFIYLLSIFLHFFVPAQESFLFFYCSVLFLFVCMLVTQSCPTLCDPTDCSPPGFSVHGILQARILEWIAIPFFTCSKSLCILDSGLWLLTCVYCRSSCILWLVFDSWNGIFWK